MPNVPFAITDGSLTFLGTRAMKRERARERDEKKVQCKGLEERGQQERCTGLDEMKTGRDQARGEDRKM